MKRYEVTKSRWPSGDVEWRLFERESVRYTDPVKGRVTGEALPEGVVTTPTYRQAISTLSLS